MYTQAFGLMLSRCIKEGNPVSWALTWAGLGEFGVGPQKFMLGTPSDGFQRWKIQEQPIMDNSQVGRKSEGRIFLERECGQRCRRSGRRGEQQVSEL